MKYIFGYETFENELNKLNIQNINYKSRKKGIRGEIIVADALNRIVTKDIFVVYHPKFSNFEPDILLCSSKTDIGFKVIEVKNWSLSNIKKVDVLGTFSFEDKTRKPSNPARQVELHVDDLRLILENKFPHIKNFLIDYMLIFPSISKLNFEEKISFKWSNEAKQQFYKRFLFKEDIRKKKDLLNKILDNKKLKHIKGQYIPNHELLDFTNGVSIGSNFDKYDIEKIMNENSQLKKRLKYKDEKIEDLKKNKKNLQNKLLIENKKLEEFKLEKSHHDLSKKTEINNLKKKNDKLKNFYIVFSSLIILSLLLIFGFIYINQQNDELNNHYTGIDTTTEVKQTTTGELTTIETTTESIQTTDTEEDIDLNTVSNIIQYGNEGDDICLVLFLTSFNYDYDSGTKFLTLSDDSGSIDAVIFEGTYAPYLEVGEKYRVIGYINYYLSDKELIITEITNE